MVHEKMKSKITSTTEENVYDYQDRTQKKNEYGLPEKHFTHRESLLTELFKNPHLKTVHHISVAMFLGLVFTIIIRDYLENYKNMTWFGLIFKSFGKFPIALVGWCALYCSTCSSFLGFKIWAYVRMKFSSPKSNLRKLWDSTAILLLVGYYIFSFRLSAGIVTKFELFPASAAIILIEQTRLLMKAHAFVRSNGPKVLEYKEKSDKELKLPTFQYFTWFLMAPTLIYRDEYPRSSTIRWKYVASYALEIFAVILFYSFVMTKLWIPMYKDFGIRKFTFTELFLTVLEASFPGITYMVVTFYLVLHLVQNFFAEILRFGDRMFYKDWWTATEFTTYYRTWNVVVHDWLYTYIYKDCYEIVLPGNKSFAKYATFFISAIVHEYILTHMFGFFFPILFIFFFIFGTLLTQVKVPKESSFFNILFWVGLSCGAGMIMSAYCMEIYVRYNDVPPIIEDYDFYIPRCITCDCYVYE